MTARITWKLSQIRIYQGLMSKSSEIALNDSENMCRYWKFLVLSPSVVGYQSFALHIVQHVFFCMVAAF